eukprot:TCONS_00002292-protein
MMLAECQSACVLLTILTLIVNSQALLFNQITSYDAFCKLPSNAIVVISSHVCEGTQPYLSLTHISNDFKIIRKTNLETPFRVNDGKTDEHGDFSTSLSKTDGYLNLTLSVGIGRGVDPIKHSFIFPTKSVDCHSQERPKKPSMETLSQRLGTYSSVVVPSSATPKSIPKMIYFLFVDPCTIPYSYTVLTSNGADTKQFIYTDTKNDSLISMAQTGVSNGGLHLVIENHKIPSTFQAKLSYLSKQDGVAETLIADVYDTQIGRICPASNCTNKNHGFDKECIVNWIDKYNETRYVETGLKFRPCERPMSGKVYLHITNSDERMIFKDYLDIASLRDNDWSVERVKKNIMRLGWYPYERTFTNSDGYLKLDGGVASLYVAYSGLGSQVMILRHFNGKIIPLLNVYFNETRDSLCQAYKREVEGVTTESHLTSILIGVLSCIAVVLLVVAVVIYCRHRTRYSRMRRHMDDSVGLPHRIQLADDEFDDDL